MNIMMGIALAGAAGWNAFLPLLELGFAHKLGPHRIPLAAPFTFLSTIGGFLILLILLPIELFLDKAPRWDALNDRFGAVYRPLAGALIMVATTRGTSLPGIVAAIIGAAVAFGMHLLKIRYRRPLTPVLAGMATPVASFVEDLLAALIGFLALIAPIAGLSLLILAALLGALRRHRPRPPHNLDTDRLKVYSIVRLSVTRGHLH